VIDHPYAAITDAEGKFAIGKIPDGEYACQEATGNDPRPENKRRVNPSNQQEFVIMRLPRIVQDESSASHCIIQCVTI
jgi:hypothetical protein